MYMCVCMLNVVINFFLHHSISIYMYYFYLRLQVLQEANVIAKKFTCTCHISCYSIQKVRMVVSIISANVDRL